VAAHVINALETLSITHEVKPIGMESEDVTLLGAPLAQIEEDDEAMQVDDDVEMGSTSPEAAKTKVVGSRGARIRVSTTDRRKCALRGEIWIETITMDEDDMAEDKSQKSKPRTHVVMKRSKGDPLEWRRLFRAIATFDGMRELIVTA
jgi:serine/threonine-protein kinase Chk1